VFTLARMKRAALLAISLAAALPAAAPAAPRLRTGIYDCTGSTGYQYYNSVRILSGGRYQWAPGRKGSTLHHPTNGKFRISGKKIIWTSGVYKRNRNESRIYANYFSIDRAQTHLWTGISCYFQPKPRGALGI
jgi:hypothetical protein